MKRPRTANVAASVRQRLLNAARASGRPFNEVLQYFAMERFLYRLSRSPHSGSFVLKGALMLSTWRVSFTRPTMDIDLLGRLDNDIESIMAVVREVCRLEVEPDGMDFDAAGVAGERIAEEAEYAGVRVRFPGHLGKARVPMRIDVGFGDAVVPGPETADYPVILDLPAPRIRGYTRESAVAEKFHAMVLRGLLNSRLRDYFDVWALARQFDFDGAVLGAAIRATFARRGFEVPSRPVALTEGFAADPGREAQWRGFLRKGRMQEVPADLAEIVAAVAVFLGPVAGALHDGRSFEGRWRAPGPWSSS